MKNRLAGSGARRSAAVGSGVRLAAALTLATAVGVSAQRPLQTRSEPGTGVVVNDIELDRPVVDALEREFGVRVLPGDYWYDAFSGLYGLRGGPGVGFTMPGLQLGGPLRADASRGGTNVFVNGRELHPMDVAALMALLGPVMPGRYWLRWDGWYGWEGGPPVGNLIAMVERAGGGAGGGGYNRTTYAGHLGSDGQSSYFFDPNTGCSVMSGGGVSC